MLFLALLACSDQYLVIDGSEDATQDAWELAELVVTSPASASFVPLEDGAQFEAHIEGPDGEILDFDEITWESNAASDWAPVGASFQETLPIGVHELKARAVLPNGDRLSYTVGGVLVQSHYAGTYAGSMVVDLITDQLSTACSGAATLTIDASGQVVNGVANCFLSIQGFDIDGDYGIDAENDLGGVDGQISLDIFGFGVPLELSGGVSEDGELSGSFSGDLAGFAQVEGELNVTRLTRDAPF